MKLYGVDFSSAPSRRKGITVAQGCFDGPLLRLTGLHLLPTLDAYRHWLTQPGPWLAALDLPFALPRGLRAFHRWPDAWPDQMRHLQTLDRAALRLACKAYCDQQPAGRKFAHRATDLLAGSSPSMKWVNPPVAYMLHAGAPPLLDAGVTLPGIHQGDPQRIALEAYPGMLARSISGQSYKSDQPARQTAQRREIRQQILAALERGSGWWGIRCDTGGFRDQLLDDGSADLLDALLCLVLAGWAWQRRGQHFGLPQFDPDEGWIVGCEHYASARNCIS